MCIAAQRADFSGTNMLLNLTRHHKHGLILVLGYENTAVNYHSGPNALLLHFPGLEMTKENFINTTGCTRIFKDLETVLPKPPVERSMRRCTYGAKIPSVQIFEHGIYTVVLAKDARDIPKALKGVASNKRPSISRELCEFYASYRDGWPIALCCFDNRDAQQSEPLLIWYKPMDQRVLVAPGLDSHTGDVPNLTSKVNVDHQLFLATDDMKCGSPVEYTSPITRDRLSDFLPKRAVGFKMGGMYPNGDFAVPRSYLMHESMSLNRVYRVGAESPLSLSS